MPIAQDKVVYLDLVLKDDAGQVLDQTDEGEPLVYLHGQGQLPVPGLEEHLLGLEVGDRRDVVVPPEEGYGMPDPDGVFSVPLDAFPKDQPLSVGDILMGEGDEGEQVPVRIVEVGLQEVRVDANHPLAGQTLRCSVVVRNIRDATPEELAHGHAHDGSGHDHHEDQQD